LIVTGARAGLECRGVPDFAMGPLVFAYQVVRSLPDKIIR